MCCADMKLLRIQRRTIFADGTLAGCRPRRSRRAWQGGPMAAVGQTEGRPAERTLFGHPVGLANLFGVELWERFSFYGMLTILGYYLYYSVTEGGLELPKTTATGIVGAYGGLVYLSTVLGGWIARSAARHGTHRVLRRRGGHVRPHRTRDPAGSGGCRRRAGACRARLRCVKANASSLLGTLYEKGDARCDGGFTLFYLGINLGPFIGPLITGLLQTRAGFHYGFGAAAVGMALGLAQYVAFRRNLGTHGRTVPNPLPRSAIGWQREQPLRWTRLGNRAPTTPRKFAYGVIGMGLAFLLFLPKSGTTGKAVPALLVVGIMAVFAVSELLLSPIGLSVTTKLAPEAFRAQMMALYFFSVGLGTSMSGVLARYYDPAHEFAYFGIIGAVAVFAGVVVFAIAPWISRLMEGVH